MDLFKQLSNPEENVFFSPLSVSIAMAMTYMGSRGDTKTQMKEVLGFSEVDEDRLHSLCSCLFHDLNTELKQTGGNYTLRIANRLYGARGHAFLQDFTDGTRYVT